MTFNMEKVFIIQPILNDNYKVLHQEAIRLIESAGAFYCGTSYQVIKEINPATFIGSGKLSEIRQTLTNLDDITILFNGEISPSQTLNISSSLEDRKVIDRTTLILDIFAKNAVTSEGKVQVELAQLKYIYPRLKGKGQALSRLGGGIGSRGPGETQLETDRRHIRTRIKYLESKLKQTENRRNLTIERRAKDNVKTIALVGYTNTGKSTLLNALTGANVLEKDALFATLDPTSRKFTIDGREFLLIDTVGFLQQLPHDIIEAFHSTLESAIHCDLALIVSDATDNYRMQFETTIQTLQQLGFHNKYIKVLNKCENITDFSTFDNDNVYVSARNQLGFDALKRTILQQLQDLYTELTLIIPYSSLSQYHQISKYANELHREYVNEGIKITASIETAYLSQFQQFISND